MNPDLQQLQTQVDGLSRKLDLLSKSSTIPFDTESAFRERLNNPRIFTGIVAPATVPIKIGDIYIDTVAAKVYEATGTSTSADWILLSNVASGGVNGRSHGTGVTSINDITNTKLTPGTNDFANGITWDSANKKFVIVTAGQYLITAGVRFTNSTDAKLYETEIYINGSIGSQTILQAGLTGDFLSPNITDIFNLAANDYVELYVYQNSGGSTTVDNSNFTYLSITKI